jgi:hypothetical protein
VSTATSGTAIFTVSCTVNTVKLPFVSLASNAIASDAKKDISLFWQDAKETVKIIKETNNFIFQVVVLRAVWPFVIKVLQR